MNFEERNATRDPFDGVSVNGAATRSVRETQGSGRDSDSPSPTLLPLVDFETPRNLSKPRAFLISEDYRGG